MEMDSPRSWCARSPSFIKFLFSPTTFSHPPPPRTLSKVCPWFGNWPCAYSITERFLSIACKNWIPCAYRNCQTVPRMGISFYHLLFPSKSLQRRGGERTLDLWINYNTALNRETTLIWLQVSVVQILSFILQICASRVEKDNLYWSLWLLVTVLLSCVQEIWNSILPYFDIFVAIVIILRQRIFHVPFPLKHAHIYETISSKSGIRCSYFLIFLHM